MNFFARLESIWGGPRPQSDERLAEERRWAERFAYSDSPHGAFVLEEARTVHEEFRGALERMDDKAGELLRTAGLFAAIVFAGLRGFQVSPSWPVQSALMLFLLAIFLALRTRWPLASSAAPSVREVCEGLPKLGEHSADFWLALSLHRTAEELRVAIDWKAERNRETTFLIVVGIALVCFAAALG